jgi:hypothetical protein
VRSVWAAWLLVVAVAVSGIVAGLDWPTWRRAAEIVAVNAILLVLLLAPSTRHFTRRGRPRFLGSARIPRAYVSAGAMAPTLSARPCSNT